MPDAAVRLVRWSAAPNFYTADIVAAANYYRDVLGFHYDRFFGDPPAFCMVHRSGVVFMLRQAPRAQDVRPNGHVDPEGETWDAYVWIDDADALWAEYRANGATIARDPCDQPYGCREFDVLDLNGYRICFGQPTRG
jgi:catechol 2,3-dioxygenase-like lactoylglutathione lyase family enzyme